MARVLSFLCIVVWLVLACVACGSDDADGGVDAAASMDGGGTGDAAAQTDCPQAPPTHDDTCSGAAGAGETCVYERCGGEGIVRARCEGTGAQARWTITYGSCGFDACNGFACAAGSVCAANVGGAYIVDCRPHACGTGPLTCECVCGADAQCEVGDTSGGGAEFTCYVDCGAEICAFPAPVATGR